jgi:predicted metal-dependent hydrolase
MKTETLEKGKQLEAKIKKTKEQIEYLSNSIKRKGFYLSTLKYDKSDNYDDITICNTKYDQDKIVGYINIDCENWVKEEIENMLQRLVTKHEKILKQLEKEFEQL